MEIDDVDLNMQLTLAFSLADAADEITLAGFRAGPHATFIKSDRSPVSEVDRRVETDLRKLVNDHQPNSGFLGEEYHEVGDGKARWIVDPLDQTRNYLRGIEIYATLIAYEANGEIQTAVISAPSLQMRWWATKGGGAFENGNKIQTSNVQFLEDAMISIHSPRKLAADGRSQGLDLLYSEAGSTYGLGNFWAHMLVARGAIDLAVSMGGKYWDYAAASLIVREAGGVFSDVNGNQRELTGSAVSSSSRLHAAVIRRMQRT